MRTYLQRRAWARRRAAAAASMLLACAALPAGAQQLNIGAGSTIALGDGVVLAGCANLDAGGTLSIEAGQASGIHHLTIPAGGSVDGGTGVISLSGNFTQQGSFNANTGEVRSVDGCGSTGSTFTGNSTFNRLSVSTTTGRTLTLPAGGTQTVLADLSLSGTSGNLLRVRSSVPGTAANIDLQLSATQHVDYVDVADSHASGQVIGPGTSAALYNSVMGTNTSLWFVPQGTTVAVPTLQAGALALLGLFTSLVAARRLRRPPARR